MFMHELGMILMVFAEKNFSHHSYPLRNQSGFFEFLYSQNHSCITLGLKTLLDVVSECLFVIAYDTRVICCSKIVVVFIDWWWEYKYNSVTSVVRTHLGVNSIIPCSIV